MRLTWLAGMMITTGALAGCTVGFPIDPKDIGSPAADAARLVVYRPSGIKLTWRSPDVVVNDVSACDLARDSGFVRDVPAGKVTLVVSLWGIDGKSVLSWTADAGKNYYVRVRVAGETSPGAVGGVFGLGSGGTPPGSKGPFDIELTDEKAALASGVTLRQCSA